MQPLGILTGLAAIVIGIFTHNTALIVLGCNAMVMTRLYAVERLINAATPPQERAASPRTTQAQPRSG